MSSLKDLEAVKKAFDDIRSNFAKEGVAHKTDDKYIVWKYGENDYNKWQTVYILKESVGEMETITAELDKQIKEARIKEIQPAFEFIKASRTPFNICYRENRDFIYTETNNSYWESDMSKSIKPLCPMASYEILDITDSTVVCRWVKDNKKKGTITYELELKHKNGKLCAESFDISKAKIVE